MKKTHAISLSNVRKSIMNDFRRVKQVLSFKDIVFDEKTNLFTITALVEHIDGTQKIMEEDFTKEGILA